MAKKGMSRPDDFPTHPHKEIPPVPELQGKAKHSKKRARPILAGTQPPAQKVWHKD